MSLQKAAELGLRPVARLLGYAVSGVDPQIMGIGPVKAVPKLMRRLGLRLPDMDAIELNEAFAAQALACIGQLNMDAQKVNPNGGAIALGRSSARQARFSPASCSASCGGRPVRAGDPMHRRRNGRGRSI